MALGDSLLSRIEVDGVGYKIFDEDALHVNGDNKITYGVNGDGIVLYGGNAFTDDDED